MSGHPHGEWAAVMPFCVKAPGRLPHRTVPLRNGGERAACYECFICRNEFWVREAIPAPRTADKAHLSAPSPLPVDPHKET